MKNPSPNSDISNTAMMTAELLGISAEGLDFRVAAEKASYFSFGSLSQQSFNTDVFT